MLHTNEVQQTNRTVGQADSSEAFPLAPTTFALALPQLAGIANARAGGYRSDPANQAEDFKWHWPRDCRSRAPIGGSFADVGCPWPVLTRVETFGGDTAAP